MSNLIDCILRFKYDENDAIQNSLPITKLFKPKNLDATMQELKLLSDVAIMKLARLQCWFVPGYYPWTFPGQMRGGPGTGPPPILSQVSAGSNSVRQLRQFIRSEGTTEIPRNIVLIDTDTGMKRFLPESVLTPMAFFTYVVQPTTLSVTISTDSASDTDQGDDAHDGDDSDHDDEITINTNASGDAGGGADLDDTIEMGVNPPISSLDPQILANLQREVRFSPGSDELGKNCNCMSI